MPRFVSRMLDMPRAAQLIMAACAAAFGFVLTMQYGFGLRPCILCLWQRVPYGMGALLALASLVNRRQAPVLLAACALCFLAGMGFAFFHSGVELHWWLGTSSCGIQPLDGGSAADLRESLLKTVAPRCDEIAWRLFGLSMANWNVPASFLLALFAGSAAAKAAAGRISR